MSIKCTSCLKVIRRNQSQLTCQDCRSTFHGKCVHADFDIIGCCLQCSTSSLPEINDEDLYESGLPDLTEFLNGKGLKLLHQNICGLYARKVNLEHILQSFKGIDILGLTETHLTDQTPTDELIVEGFDFERNDRRSGFGGGVGVYIKQDVPYRRRYDLEAEHENIECIWIEVLFPKSKGIMIGNIYRPPDPSKYSDSDFNDKLDEVLNAVHVSDEKKEILLLGDLNCNFLESACKRQLKQVFSMHGLKQIIQNATRITKSSASLIDIVLSSNPERIINSKVISAHLSDHDMVGITRKINASKFKARIITTRCFARYDRSAYRNDVKNSQWDNVYEQSDVNDAWHQNV